MKNSILQREKREMEILYTLDELGYLSRSQIQRLHDLKSTRNANRVLKQMEDYLNSFRQNEKIYYLNAEGRQRIGSEKIRKKTPQIVHHLLRNEVYIAYDKPDVWKPETPIKTGSGLKIVADCLFKANGKWFFLEVDHKQKMIENKKKIKHYKQLHDTELFQSKYGHFPMLLWVTTSKYRAKQIESLCNGLETFVITMNDLI